MEMRFVCDMKWDDLQGKDAKRRDCDSCEKPVYNLSGMTRQQAAKFLASYGDKPPCVRFVSRDGEIVHNGDPFEQLARQRRGTKILIGAAVALHLGIAGFAENPFLAVLTPFNILELGVDHSDDCGREVVGEMLVEVEGIIPNPGELPSFNNDVKTLEFARANLLEADTLLAQGGPTALYSEYRALYRADVALQRLITPPVPADLEAVSRRALAAEAELKAKHREFRVAHHHLTQRHQSDEIAALVRDYLSTFSDEQNSWAVFAKGKQHELENPE